MTVSMPGPPPGEMGRLLRGGGLTEREMDLGPARFGGGERERERDLDGEREGLRLHTQKTENEHESVCQTEKGRTSKTLTWSETSCGEVKLSGFCFCS